MGTTDPLPFMPNREELKRLLDARVDPDAERFRYFGQAMLDSVFGLDTTAQCKTLREIMDSHEPRTLDELRACIDAARLLAP